MNEILLGLLIITVYYSPVFYQLVIVIREYKSGNKNPFKRLRTFLKYSLIILIPLVIIFAIISHTNYLNYERPSGYDRIDEITFENFRGLEFFKKSLYGSKRFAYIVTSIESEINDDNVIIQSYFHPSRSFVYNSHTNSAELLKHELYHFKITELYSRKAKQEISQLKEFNKGEISSIIRQTNQDTYDFQKKYDYDTFHSYVLSEQKKYEQTIDSLLLLLSEFRNSKVVLND